MALRGIPSCSAVSGLWTITRPPSALIALSPSVPSLPVPEKMMQMARSCWHSARLRKKPSMGRGMPGRATAAPRCRTPPLIVSNAFGGMMWTCSAWTSAPSCACATSIGVCRRSSSGRWLTWVGSRCGITTKPRPLWAGMALKNLFNASSPPAEAPIATTGKSLGRPAPGSSGSAGAPATGRSLSPPGPDRSAGGFFVRPLTMMDPAKNATRRGLLRANAAGRSPPLGRPRKDGKPIRTYCRREAVSP